LSREARPHRRASPLCGPSQGTEADGRSGVTAAPAPRFPCKHPKYQQILALPQPLHFRVMTRCSACRRRLGLVSLWPTHRGGPICPRCVDDDDMLKLVDRLEHPAWFAQPSTLRRLHELAQAFPANPEGLRCAASGCNRLVLDFRNRGQWFLACSEACRRAVHTELRRVERRAQRRPPPARRCEQCVGELGASRSDARFCSVRCRVAAHRARTAERGSVPVELRR
jgi:hypothetical protein